MVRRGFVMVATTAMLAAAAATASAGVPAGATWTEETIVSADGTRLHADVFLPAGLPEGARVPVVLDAGPYFGRTGGPAPVFPLVPGAEQLLAAGYAIVDVDLRGYGGSGGCFSFHGSADRADMGAVVDWARRRPWSDGRLAVSGFSYDGGAALNAIVARRGAIDAAIVMSPVADTYRALWMNGVAYASPLQASAFGPALSANDAAGPALGGSADGEATNATSADPACWAERNVGIAGGDPASAFWRERDVLAHLGRSRVPVLLSYGFGDTNLKPAALPDLLRAFRGPRRAWLGQFDHWQADQDDFDGGTNIGRTGFPGEVLRWLDHHLRGVGPAPQRGFVVQEGAGGWRRETRWPPRDRSVVRMRLRAGTYRDEPGNTADGRGPDTFFAGRLPSSGQGKGIWTFSQPLPHPLHLAGAPKLAVRAAGPAGAHVVGLLYDVAPDGTATLVSRGASLLGPGGRTALRLYAQDWRLPAGHRLGALITAADDSLFRPPTTLGTVTVSGGRLRLPFLRAPRTDDETGGPNTAIAERAPFTVPPETIAAATVEQRFPGGRRR